MPVTPLGISLITFQRAERLKAVVERIRRHTTTPYMLVVAEDGGDDETVDWCRAEGIRVATGQNRGVCWNKNRGLFALRAADCRTLLTMEDDIYPITDAWERDWVIATERWDHLSFAHPKLAGTIIEGTGTPLDPYVNTKATAQCTSVSARALEAVGYLDTRFRGYGVGHAEWTTRIKRAGFGYKESTLADGRKARANLYLRGGLRADDAPSFRDNRQVAANRELFRQIKREPVFRFPWSDEAERRSFLDEQAAMVVARDIPPDSELAERYRATFDALVRTETELAEQRMRASPAGARRDRSAHAG